MSHAANLKLRQAHASLPSKRQRQSLEASTSSHKANGVHIPFVNGDSKLSAVPTRDVKRRKREHDDDANKVPALVAGTDAGLSTPVSQEIVEISSGDEEDEEDDDSDDSSVEMLEDHAEIEDDSSKINGIKATRPVKSNAKLIAPAQTDDVEEGEMSFGDLLVAKHGQDPVSIDVAEVEAKGNTDALAAYQPRGALTAPNAASLGTVLTQALKTNDVELLESCLRVGNLDSIRATIERLHSSLAASLLSKLAERMHKRPGRAGSLMVWVQWTVVAHGGYLATQPAAMQQLRMLYQVVKQRASGLQPLLALKGKLDMLEAQMQLRRRMQERSRELHGDEAEPYIYVEGEESEDEGVNTSQQKHIALNAEESDEDEGEDDDGEDNSEDEDEDEDEDEVEDDDEGPVDELDDDSDHLEAEDNALSEELNQIRPVDGVKDSEDEDEDEDDDEDNLIDDEAEETDDDESSENEEDGDEYLEGEEVDSASSEEEPQPTPKRSKSRK